MPDFNAWTGNTLPLTEWLDDIDRSTDTARLIAEKSASIVITRAGVQLAAQTVRLEPMSLPSETTGSTYTVSNAGVLIVGYKDHATITNTNIRRGDRFQYPASTGPVYTVTQVLPDIPKRLLATAETGR